MSNLSSYCGLVDAKIRASDKDLPVLNKVSIFWNNVSIVHTNSYRRDLWLNDFGVECRNIRNITQIYRQTDSIWQLLNPICDHVVEFSCRILNFVYIKVSSTFEFQAGHRDIQGVPSIGTHFQFQFLTFFWLSYQKM